MWITFWAVTIALAIGLSVMAMGTQPKKTAPRRFGDSPSLFLRSADCGGHAAMLIIRRNQ